MATLRAGIFGQNIAARLVSPRYTGVLQAEVERSGNTIETITFSSTNSSLLARNARADVSNNHWWDDANDLPGPALLQALNYIALAVNKPTFVLFDPGTLDGVEETFDAEVYKSALRNVLLALQSACDAETPTNVRLALLFASKHGGNEEQAELRWLRYAQYAIVQEMSISSVDAYDLPAYSEAALYEGEETIRAITTIGMSRLCYRLAHCILDANNIAAYKPATLEVTRLSTHTIAVQFNDISYPLNTPEQVGDTAERLIPHLSIIRPGGFVAYDKDWMYITWQYSASGSVMVLELMNTELAEGSILLYPDNDLSGPLLDRVVLRNAVDIPLRTTAHIL